MRLALAALSPRMFPVLASGAIHASLAVSALATTVGHAAPGARSEAVLTFETVEIAPPEAPAPPPETPPEPVPAAAPAVHSHTHPYPVAESHDAVPHDPSLVHTAPAAEPEAAPAPAVATSEAPAPRFTIVLGPSPSTAGKVAAGADGNGAGAGHGHDHDAEHESETVAESMVSVAAKLVSSATPAYPTAARASEVEAEVPLDILVDTSGRVVDASVRTRAGYGFDEAALAAVRGYRFSPAQRNGRPVRVRMRWSVQFRLR